MTFRFIPLCAGNSPSAKRPGRGSSSTAPHKPPNSGRQAKTTIRRSAKASLRRFGPDMKVSPSAPLAWASRGVADVGAMAACISGTNRAMPAPVNFCGPKGKACCSPRTRPGKPKRSRKGCRPEQPRPGSLAPASLQGAPRWGIIIRKTLLMYGALQEQANCTHFHERPAALA